MCDELSPQKVMAPRKWQPSPKTHGEQHGSTYPLSHLCLPLSHKLKTPRHCPWGLQKVPGFLCGPSWGLWNAVWAGTSWGMVTVPPSVPNCMTITSPVRWKLHRRLFFSSCVNFVESTLRKNSFFNEFTSVGKKRAVGDFDEMYSVWLQV
jgi:hypothetical protein